MVSGHRANPILFNRKIKIGRPEHLLPTTAPHTRSRTSPFYFIPQPLPLQSGSHMCFSPKGKHFKYSYGNVAISRCLKNFCGFANIALNVSHKIGIKMKKILK